MDIKTENLKLAAEQRDLRQSIEKLSEDKKVLAVQVKTMKDDARTLSDKIKYQTETLLERERNLLAKKISIQKEIDVLKLRESSIDNREEILFCNIKKFTEESDNRQKKLDAEADDIKNKINKFDEEFRTKTDQLCKKEVELLKAWEEYEYLLEKLKTLSNELSMKADDLNKKMEDLLARETGLKENQKILTESMNKFEYEKRRH